MAKWWGMASVVVLLYALWCVVAAFWLAPIVGNGNAALIGFPVGLVIGLAGLLVWLALYSKEA